MLTIGATAARAEKDNAPSNDPYDVLVSVTTFSIKKDDPRGCHAEATLDFEQFLDKIGVFREAWLNRDFTDDFYKIRGRQVAAYIVAKHIAMLMSGNVYIDSHENAPDCKFAISAKYDDKYGNSQTIALTSWRFDRVTANKVNWAKIEARFFGDVALDYKFADGVKDWVSHEPSLAGDKPEPVPEGDSCNMMMFRANAVFIRATTFCRKNYMDSPAGYKALDESRKCLHRFNGEDEMKSEARKAMEILNDLVKKGGRAAGCSFVESLSREVMKR